MKFKEIINKCGPTMIRRWGSCFIVDYFTTEDVSDSFSGFSFNRKMIDVNSMTSEDLMKSLYAKDEKDKNKDFFIEALFSIMAYTYEPVVKVYQKINLDDVKDFFIKSVVGKEQSKHLKLLNDSLVTKEVLKNSSKIEKTDEKVSELTNDVAELKKRIYTLEETIRIDREKHNIECEKYKSNLKKLVGERAELNASRRDISEQLDRKRKFCNEYHEIRNTEKKIQITKFDLYGL